MDSVQMREDMDIRDEIITKACSMAMKAHKSSEKYVSEKIRSSPEVVFCFPGSWHVNDWFSKVPFGVVEADLQLFPSLKYIGLGEVATVNEAFLNKFKAVLDKPNFINEVHRAVTDRKQVVFTGHSLGGATAILATVWFLEKYIRPNTNKVSPLKPLCLTFGAPLVGDYIMNHALRRENWSHCFTNFVTRYDIFPRISLTPLSSIQQQLQMILNFLNPNSPFYKKEPVAEIVGFFVTVMKNASSVASHAACKIMGSTNPLLETVSSFIELSPYRPSGTYIFCAGNGKLVVVSNPDAVLQLLFYSSQTSSAEDIATVAQRSLRGHLNYKDELQESLQMHSITLLDQHHRQTFLTSSNLAEINIALNDLGLSERARLCLRAAEELEKQKMDNQDTISKKKKDIEDGLKKLEAYKSKCALRKVGYYDAFKISNDKEDFHANVARLELAGIWDEIIEMLKRRELPDGFECQKEWIDLGTQYRRIVEPLDIANYYRHLKNEDTGPYMGKGRPKRYKCTQKWCEHGLRLPNEYPGPGSCFWAEVEELWIKSSSPGTRESIMALDTKVQKWIQDGELGEDVRLENSTFEKLKNETGCRPT